MIEASDKPTSESSPSKQPRGPDRRSTDWRQPYHRPRLEEYGEIRDVTMGVTPGGLESGGISRKPIGG